jgi:hypothetical protein
MSAHVVVASPVTPGLQCYDINCRPVVWRLLAFTWSCLEFLAEELLRACKLGFCGNFFYQICRIGGWQLLYWWALEVLHRAPYEPHYFGRVGGITRSKSFWSEGFHPVFGFWTGPGCSVSGDTTNCPDLPTYDAAGAPGAAPLPLADAEPPPVLSLGGAASAPSTGLPAISALPGIGALTAAPPAGTCACAQGAGENTCPAGWMGANCDACVSDDVCKTQTGDSAATCHKGFDYTE